MRQKLGAGHRRSCVEIWCRKQGAQKGENSIRIWMVPMKASFFVFNFISYCSMVSMRCFFLVYSVKVCSWSHANENFFVCFAHDSSCPIYFLSQISQSYHGTGKSCGKFWSASTLLTRGNIMWRWLRSDTVKIGIVQVHGFYVRSKAVRGTGFCSRHWFSWLGLGFFPFWISAVWLMSVGSCWLLLNAEALSYVMIAQVHGF